MLTSETKTPTYIIRVVSILSEKMRMNEDFLHILKQNMQSSIIEKILNEIKPRIVIPITALPSEVWLYHCYMQDREDIRKTIKINPTFHIKDNEAIMIVKHQFVTLDRNSLKTEGLT